MLFLYKKKQILLGMLYIIGGGKGGASESAAPLSFKGALYFCSIKYCFILAVYYTLLS